MGALSVCLSLNIYYLLLRLVNIVFINNTTTYLATHNVTYDQTTVHPLDCSHLNCRGNICVLNTHTGATVCPDLCNDGWCGSTCQRRCPRRCHKCNKLSGVCDKCREGWRGLKCNTYIGQQNKKLPDVLQSGSQLLQPRRHCADEECSYCEKGWYGKDCLSQCPRSCDSGCNAVTGKCD